MSINTKQWKTTSNKKNLEQIHKIKNCRIKCMSKKCKFNIKQICLKGFVWITKDNFCKSYEKNE